MKVAIVGSRNFIDLEFFKLTMNRLRSVMFVIDVIVSGGAKGVDQFAELYATHNSIRTEIYRPDWDTLGRSAGFIRNMKIVEAADIIIAFWDDESKGTKDTINKALKAKKTCFVFIV